MGEGGGTENGGSWLGTLDPAEVRFTTFKFSKAKIIQNKPALLLSHSCGDIFAHTSKKLAAKW